MESYFDRTIQALGQETFDHLQRVRVILFGAGGVGGWCAEALVRTGVKHLTIVDFDVVNPSNINRQVVATRDNIGAPKVKELQKRLLAINPDAEITTINQRYSAQTAETFDFNSYDYVLDAIDSVKDKALLLYRASLSHATVFSSMGAGRKMDTTAVRVTAFKKVEGCPLARAVRHQLKNLQLQTSNFQLPTSNILCVWSPELSSASGTLAPVVMTFGSALANFVIQDIASQDAK
ncbi:MAG: tRNA threonylcarbamoyladenosine dehydratase [Paludibacteraceae bacterium]|nr:tRNA threonylcarbamoyladenosine dehydratase [Paludibacteraceae bacterium]